MKWQDIVYGGYIAGTAMIFAFLMLDLLSDYSILAQDPTGSAACCISAARSTLAIACGVVMASVALSLIRNQLEI